MSLLDRGTETLTIYPAGEMLPDGTIPELPPIELRARVQPSSSSAEDADGYQDATTYRVLGRAFPAGPWARVHWQGRDWTVVGEPSRYTGSSRVTHDVAVIRRR
ncbi:hypothetical protein [Streptomyces sp. NBC_00932]|uniref:hypothetical protein n=1 Tax=Streptomyces sp. NBC_00932 TaxID=2903690 RepID=UPI00386F496F|nr:hypothetical protein OG221_27835 [Streptomyces sp. NBC_00932]